MTATSPASTTKNSRVTSHSRTTTVPAGTVTALAIASHPSCVLVGELGQQPRLRSTSGSTGSICPPPVTEPRRASSTSGTAVRAERRVPERFARESRGRGRRRRLRGVVHRTEPDRVAAAERRRRDEPVAARLEVGDEPTFSRGSSRRPPPRDDAGSRRSRATAERDSSSGFPAYARGVLGESSERSIARRNASSPKV